MFGVNKKYIYIIFFIIVAATSTYKFMWAESPEDRLRKLSQELSDTVKTTDLVIDGNIGDAFTKIDEHLQQIKHLQQCVTTNQTARAYNKAITVEQFLSGGIMPAVDCATFTSTYTTTQSGTTLTTTGTATGAINPVPKRTSKQLTPDELFYTTARYDKCDVSQSDSKHFKANKRHAVDIACTFGGGPSKQAVVFAPDFRNKVIKYTVTSLFKSDVTGDTIDLAFEQDGTQFFWRLGHTENKLVMGQVLYTGDRIGQMNLSGMTTGYHTHIELWVMAGGQYINVDYTTRSQSVNNIARGSLDKTVTKFASIYATQYNLGDVNQNDASPFIGASGKDLRHVVNPIALTSDVRKIYGIQFGDKITMVGPCTDTYQVEDEMNIRFRTSCIRNGDTCIKADIAIQPGERKNCAGVYQISKP